MKEIPVKSESWKMFDDIAPRYDFLNHLLSLNCDLAWRRRLSDYLPETKNLVLLDCATGTGDVALTLVKNNASIEEAIGIDLAGQMLAIGRRKVNREQLSNKIKLETGDIKAIPYAAEYFDVVTIAFGIRNVDHPVLGLKEIYRVLKHRGRALILEFSLPSSILLRSLHLGYLRLGVPAIGGFISGNFKAYQYLNRTVKCFPYGEQFCRILEQVGFLSVESHPLLGGIATIYQGDKLISRS